MQDVGDASECAWPHWDMVDGVISGDAEHGKESAGFAGEAAGDTSGVWDDGLAEYVLVSLVGMMRVIYLIRFYGIELVILLYQTSVVGHPSVQ